MIETIDDKRNGGLARRREELILLEELKELESQREEQNAGR